MKFLKYSTLFLIGCLTITSCSEPTYKFKLDTTQKTSLGKKASIIFKQLEGNKIDSVHFYVKGKRLANTNNTVSVNTSDLGIGKHAVTALAFYPGKVKKLNNYIEVFAESSPVGYTYKIVNEYPHDKNSYTQGLEFHNGYLYETTGRRGQSWLRKIDYKTGKVLQQYDLDKKYFGEGVTIMNNKIHWLTWQAGKGFTYDLNSFKQLGEFNYDKSLQGWGLTHNESELIKSDGTNKIWFLDPTNLQEKRFIEVYSNKHRVDRLNELEWVDGKIYANRWITDRPIKSIIVIINPTTGAVEGIANLNGLRKDILKTQKLVDQDEVLNGIAYNPKTKTFFVTGKNWGKLYEIELIKQ